jgi:hypothetical protein
VPDVLTNIFAAQSDVHLKAICEGRIFHPPVFCIFTAETTDVPTSFLITISLFRTLVFG